MCFAALPQKKKRRVHALHVCALSHVSIGVCGGLFPFFSLFLGVYNQISGEERKEGRIAMEAQTDRVAVYMF